MKKTHKDLLKKVEAFKKATTQQQEEADSFKENMPDEEATYDALISSVEDSLIRMQSLNTPRK